MPIPSNFVSIPRSQILEFAASLPENLKVRGLTTKYLAKRALSSRILSQS